MNYRLNMTNHFLYTPVVYNHSVNSELTNPPLDDVSILHGEEVVYSHENSCFQCLGVYWWGVNFLSLDDMLYFRNKIIRELNNKNISYLKEISIRQIFVPLNKNMIIDGANNVVIKDGCLVLSLDFDGMCLADLIRFE